MQDLTFKRVEYHYRNTIINVVLWHCDSAFSNKCVTKIFFFFFHNQTICFGTQKNRLNETVLLSSKTHVYIDG